MSDGASVEPDAEPRTFKDQGPVQLLCLINKYAQVDLVKDCSFTGYIHSIDSDSKSLILMVPQGEIYQTVLLPGYTVDTVTEIPPPDNQKPVRKTIVEIPDSEISIKKAKVIGWLKQNLLPVAEKEDAIEIRGVLILPPFTKLDICTDNLPVATQIKKLLEKMPEDMELS